ncbi:MAG: amino acid permease [Maribacter sp.]|nr:MAG: amino acid permease [Maribacter sp.]
MGHKIKNWVAASIIPQIILVKWLGSHPDIIENYYSRGIYPWISRFFRILYGWIPFSVGDILYFVLSLLAIRYIYKHWLEIKTHPLLFLRNTTFVLSIAYFTFHLLWGLNYYREPIAKRLALDDRHTEEELLALTEALIQKTKALQYSITKDTALAVEIPYTQKEIFDKTLIGYGNLEKDYPFLAYRNPSIKTSLFSTGLSYMGYGGYLNPFTHEGQANGRLPNFRFPVVTGHEIGHQLGYSAENETNLIGYLATLNNPDIYFKYIAYSYALTYCLRDLQRNDEAKFKEMYAQVSPGTQKNFEEMARFWESFENPMEPVFKSIFNIFLKANNQKQGIKSYNTVVSLMVAYHKDHPIQ